MAQYSTLALSVLKVKIIIVNKKLINEKERFFVTLWLIHNIWKNNLWNQQQIPKTYFCLPRCLLPSLLGLNVDALVKSGKKMVGFVSVVGDYLGQLMIVIEFDQVFKDLRCRDNCKNSYSF